MGVATEEPVSSALTIKCGCEISTEALKHLVKLIVVSETESYKNGVDSDILWIDT